MLGAKKHARHFPKVPGNADTMLGTMLGTACSVQKMLGVHVRRTGFPFKKEQTERYHTTIYSATK